MSKSLFVMVIGKECKVCGESGSVSFIEDLYDFQGSDVVRVSIYKCGVCDTFFRVDMIPSSWDFKDCRKGLI